MTAKTLLKAFFVSMKMIFCTRSAYLTATGLFFTLFIPCTGFAENDQSQ